MVRRASGCRRLQPQPRRPALLANRRGALTGGSSSRFLRKRAFEKGDDNQPLARLPASAWPPQRARGGSAQAEENGCDDDHTPNNVDEIVTTSAACSLRSSCAADLGTALTLAYGGAR